MPAMCPIDGCQSKKGLCIHEKMMLGMGVVGAVLAVAHWGFGLF